MPAPLSCLHAYPHFHGHPPPLAGRLKSLPHDFVVEEIPAYLPAGEGHHLFLWLEKVDISAEQLLRHLARTLHIASTDIGLAGLKDRRAVTRQWVSVPAACVDRLPAVETDQIHVLEIHRHSHKLRTGHLRGNRFRILLRDAACRDLSPDPVHSTAPTSAPAWFGSPGGPEQHPPPDPVGATARGGAACSAALRQAQALAAVICQRGFPNYFGEQRFGREGDTLQWGWDLLTQAKSPRDIPYSRRKFLLKLALSAVQAELFNRALAERLGDGLVDTVLAGDVMAVVASGGQFLAEDPAVEQPRCDRYETVITGPLFGPKMRQPRGEPGEREQRLLTHVGLSPAAFAAFGHLLAGTRRAYLVRPPELLVSAVPEGLRFEFTLPPGVYATTLLREFVGAAVAED
jgi:tRNA pseudouridine13 synthase